MGTRRFATLMLVVATVLVGVSIATAPLPAAASPALLREQVLLGADRYAGERVAVSGDLAAVKGAGRLTVYRRIGANWQHDQVIQTQFYEVAIDGDQILLTTGDGVSVYERFVGRWLVVDVLPVVTFVHDRIAVSNGTAVISQERVKSVHVFTRVGRTWTKQATLPVPSPGSLSGLRVAIDDDVIVAGLRFGNGAFVYERAGATWSAPIELPLPADPRRFGDEVAVAAGRVLVLDSGELYPYAKVDGVWEPDGAPASFPSSFRPRSVAMTGDLAVAGDYLYSASGLGTGGVQRLRYVAGTGWALDGSVFRPSDAVDEDRFGVAVTTDGSTVLVGSTHGDWQTGRVGRGYAYDLGDSSGPSISSLGTTSGPVAGGTELLINGSGFTATSEVLFGDQPAVFEVLSASQIRATSPAHAAGAVSVRVQTPVGLSPLVPAGTFTYNNPGGAPSVSSVSPTSDAVAGGRSVTISGADLSGATDVSFGGTSAMSFTVRSATEITAVAPPHTAGTVDLVVTGPAGASAATTASQFAYIPDPVITAMSLPGGALGGGNMLKISGYLFTDVVGVTVDGQSVASTVSPTSIQITTPPHAAGPVNVAVVTTHGTSAATPASTFWYSAPPTVTSVSPDRGPNTGGTRVVITGTGFNAASRVTFGSQQANFIRDSDTQITAVTPSNNPSIVHTRVYQDGVGSATHAGDRFEYVDNIPIVTGVSPSSGSTDGGTAVVITGERFTGVDEVVIGQQNVPFTIDSDTQITAMTVGHGPGTVNVHVWHLGWRSPVNPAATFTFLPPVITGISPNRGPVAGGNEVTITGSGFLGVHELWFGSLYARGLTVRSDTEMTVSAPEWFSAPATVDVIVWNDGGPSVATELTKYTYVGPPRITSLSPTSGPTAGGTVVTVTGSSLAGATDVRFDGAPATQFTVDSDSQITAVAPPNARGARYVQVITPDGDSAEVAASRFTYHAPTVASISPTTGPHGGGTTVTITGSRFTGVDEVSFGSSGSTSFTVVSDSQIDALSPPHLPGTVDVRVSDAGDTSLTSAASTFTYTGEVARVTAVSPAAGPTAGGQVVTLTGTRFVEATAVVFGSTSTLDFSVVDDTTINVVAPPQPAGDVDVRVVTALGVSPTHAAARYTYTAPTVAALSPAEGATAGGTEVVITGSGFSGATVVRFGSNPATFSIDSDSQITAAAPPHPSGVVDVVVADAGASSSTGAGSQFTYRPEATRIFSLSASRAGFAGGELVTINGEGFTGAIDVRVGDAPVTSFAVVSDVRIDAVLPSIAPAVLQLRSMRVTSPLGTSPPTMASWILLRGEPEPTVTSVDERDYRIGETPALVHIVGTGLGGTTRVRFGPYEATIVSVTDTEIVVDAPAFSGTAPLLVNIKVETRDSINRVGDTTLVWWRRP